MNALANCHCLICELENSVAAELQDDPMRQKYSAAAASSGALAGFPNAFSLIEKLHARDDRQDNLRTDPLLLDLLGHYRLSSSEPVWQRLLLLVFIPTIHRTASQISARFPSLARQDIAQNVLAIFLERLHSEELHRRRSHIAFAVARTLRRQAFRWAIHESRNRPLESEEAPAGAEGVASGGPFAAGILLHEFLDDCEKTGWLSPVERALLLQFKVEGISCAELARRNGHSAVAIRHRIQRLLERLRRIARNGDQASRQLELFD